MERKELIFKICFKHDIIHKLKTKLNQWLLKTSPLCSHQGPKYFFFCVYSSCHPRPVRRGDTLFTKVDAAHTDPPAGLNLPWPLLPL